MEILIKLLAVVLVLALVGFNYIGAMDDIAYISPSPKYSEERNLKNIKYLKITYTSIFVVFVLSLVSYLILDILM